MVGKAALGMGWQPPAGAFPQLVLSPSAQLLCAAEASQSQGKETSQEVFPTSRAYSLQAFLSTQLA